MSQPPPYSPSHSFVSDSATLPNFPGQALDVEFNAISLVTGAIEADLSLIQRDDGALKNGVVTYDSLSSSLQTNGITGALPWVTGTPYIVGSAVVQSNKLYRCLIAHTSGVFATDLAAGDWVFVLGVGLSGPATSAAGHLPVFHDTAGVILDDSGVALASLAPLASPALTGAPTAPTAAVDTNTTQIASTAFVLAQAAAVVPLPEAAAGAIGVSTRFARADHVHPEPANDFWRNTRLAKTANYTVANATDKFLTIALGGNAFYTLTVGAASGYDANFAVVVTNEDSTVSGGFHTGRCKTIAISGYPSFKLWPGQSLTIFNQNNVWRFDLPGRWIVQGLPTFNVDHANGNDTTGDGLATGSGAFATIQAAVIAFESYVDCNNFGPTIQNAAETFTENNVAHTHPLTGYHVISITGNTATPGNCIWQVSGTGNVAIQCRDTGLAIVTGFKFVSTGTGNFFISGSQDGVCDFGSLEFGANPGGFNIFVSPGGAANFFGGTMSWTGDCAGMVLMTGEGHLLFDGCTISVPSARAISSAFAQCAGPCYASMTSMTFTGTGAASGSTGAKYLVLEGAQLNITSTTLPGASSGTAYAGGIVFPLLASKTNDNAQAGDIGEYIEGVVLQGAAVAVVTTTPKTITSITLTSGDWDVNALVYVTPAATTSVTRYIGCISGTTNTIDTSPGKYTDINSPAFVPGAVTLTTSIPNYRLTVASGATLTVFLVTEVIFTISTAAAWGIVRARRCR